MVSAPVAAKSSYAYRLGALSMAARLYLLGLSPRANLIRAVNAENDPEYHQPVPENEPCTCPDRAALLSAAKLIESFAVAWEPLTPGDITELTAAIAKAEGRQ